MLKRVKVLRVGNAPSGDARWLGCFRQAALELSGADEVEIEIERVAMPREGNFQDIERLIIKAESAEIQLVDLVEKPSSHALVEALLKKPLPVLLANFDLEQRFIGYHRVTNMHMITKVVGTQYVPQGVGPIHDRLD